MDPIVAGAFIDGSASSTHSGKRVLGVRLKKFCLWHRLLLKTVNSPFMKKGNVTMLDLRIAVGICRLKPFDSKVRKPWIIPTWIYLQAVTASLCSRKRKSGTSAQADQMNALQRALDKQATAFLSYCEDYLQEPEYSIIPPPTGKGYVPQTPRGKFDDCIEHAGELIVFGIPERRAWEMPLGMANVYRVIARRAAGSDVDITDEQEKEFRKNVPQEYRIVR